MEYSLVVICLLKQYIFSKIIKKKLKFLILTFIYFCIYDMVRFSYNVYKIYYSEVKFGANEEEIKRMCLKLFVNRYNMFICYNIKLMKICLPNFYIN